MILSSATDLSHPVTVFNPRMSDKTNFTTTQNMSRFPRTQLIGSLEGIVMSVVRTTRREGRYTESVIVSRSTASDQAAGQTRKAVTKEYRGDRPGRSPSDVLQHRDIMGYIFSHHTLLPEEYSMALRRTAASVVPRVGNEDLAEPPRAPNSEDKSKQRGRVRVVVGSLSACCTGCLIATES